MASTLIHFFESQGGQNSSSGAFLERCLALMDAQVRQLDKNYTDLHVKSVVDDACVDGGLFSANDTADRQACTAFARRLTGAWRAAATADSKAGYEDFCKEYTSLALTWRAPAAHKRARAVESPQHSQSQNVEEEEEEQEAAEAGSLAGPVWLIQLIFGIVYYFMVVSKYPKVDGTTLSDNHAARLLQQKNEVLSLPEVSAHNCVLSFCCPAARAAHTFDSTNTLNYWATFLIMMCISPCFCINGGCCLLFIMNSCTPVNEKLGGEKRNPILGLLCAWCCQCCVIAQDAESLDLVANAKTTACGFTMVDESTKDES